MTKKISEIDSNGKQMTTTENWFSEFSEIIFSENTEKKPEYFPKLLKNIFWNFGKSAFRNFGKADDFPFKAIENGQIVQNSFSFLTKV